MDRGEAALSNVGRVRAIGEALVPCAALCRNYKGLTLKRGRNGIQSNERQVQGVLKPFAETGQPVSAEDIKAYFAKLRGDEEATR